MSKNLMMVCEAKLVLEKQGESTGKIEATVTTWGARIGEDGRRFNYQPEGFMQWAEDFSKSGRPLPMFVNHDADAIPVGEWNAFEFDDAGMKAEGRLYVNTTAGSDLYKIMQESPAMFGGVSVGAYAETYQMVNADGEPDQSDEAYFQITKGGLREVSVVMYPNNPNAEVSKLEYFRPDGSADLKVLEQALREVGLSKKDAVAAASTFKKVLELRDATPTPIETAPILSDSNAEATEAEILAALEARELLKLLDTKIKG
ncbi:Prohead protease [uncultured Caudovirales phage]|uniref:Prohead protease n=1 Tax=uncultured Caudovirales phage TaxID=2100421 RepID=A0A6J7W9H9_9CAUD|nr:Prohead protease [uncultured Caudovirales phage]